MPRVTGVRRVRHGLPVLLSLGFLALVGWQHSGSREAALEPGRDPSAFEAGGPAPPTTPPAARPHLVLITVDTLRADHIGLYGYARDTTPRIDSFFARGTVFENATSTAPCTLPTMQQMLSGIYRDDRARKNVAQVLEAAGYRTAAVVSHHLFHHERVQRFERGFQHFDIQPETQVDMHGMTARSAEEVSTRAIAWLEGAKRKQEPFFLWLHYFDPHDPYEPPAAHRAFVADSTSQRTGDRRSDLQAAPQSEDVPWMARGSIFSAEDVAHLVGLYDGEIHYTDAEVGRVLDAMERLGLIEDSVVVLTADHGERLGEKNLWDHCSGLTESQIRVPLLVVERGMPLSGMAASERRPTVAVSTVDIAPTLLARAGVAPAPGRYPGSDVALARSPRTVVSTWGNAWSVRDARYKLILSDSLRPRLYDIRADPAEQENLAKRDAANVKRLRALLARHVESLQHAKSLSNRAEEELRAIGYIE